jgi:hypothetical protein
MTVHAPRLPFSLDPLMAEAKRRMCKRRVLILVSAVLLGGGSAGATVALSQSNGFKAAAACPGASAYVYAVPSYPGQAPPAPAWPPGQGGDYWEWMALWHPLKVGNWVRVRWHGQAWRVTAIAATPGDCKFMALGGLGGRSRPIGGSVAGRLILQPVS